MSSHEYYRPFIAEAIRLAKKGRFKTCPNPTVGAVLVRDDKIIAKGWHKGYGLAHAEVDCLNDALERGVDTRGATMCVTLEPCRHQGKTPPCTDALIDAGISRLVYGTTDPNPEAQGGARILADEGIEVIGPVLEQECRDLIADFVVWQTTDRPYIILKLASTLDGRIATRTGHSRWISDEESRKAVHRLRAGVALAHGASLIGGGTFRADDPELTARDSELKPERQPLACIITSRLPKADADFKLLQQRPQETIFFASPAAAASTTAEALRKRGCRVIAIGRGIHGGPDYPAMFHTLREELGCPYVLCEGGGQLALSLLEAGFVDEFHLYLAPMILGDNNAKPLFDGRAPLSLDEALAMRICTVEADSRDVCLVLRPALHPTGF